MRCAAELFAYLQLYWPYFASVGQPTKVRTSGTGYLLNLMPRQFPFVY